MNHKHVSKKNTKHTPPKNQRKRVKLQLETETKKSTPETRQRVTIEGTPVATIYKTTDYSKFKVRDDNRELKLDRVKKLMKSMGLHGWVRGSIVVINEFGEIIDGHGRFLSARELGIPFDYVMMEGTGFEEILQLNSGGVNWSKFDHISGWSKKGNENYIIMKKMIEDFPEFRKTEITMFLLNMMKSVDTFDFQTGNFKVKDVNVGYQWGEEIRRLQPVFPQGYNKSIFVRALVKILSKKPEFDFEVFYKKSVKYPYLFELQQNTNKYIDMIEEIYNYKNKSNRVNLRIL